MSKRMGRIVTAFWLLVSCLLLTGCLREPLEVESVSADFPEGAPITLTFSVSKDDLNASLTRSFGEESTLNSLHLAVFGSSGYLKEYVEATELTLSDEPYVYNDLDGVERSVEQYTFTVTLTMSDSPRIIHFIGNGPSTLPFGYADAVLSSLLSERGEGAYWQMKRLDGIRACRSVTEYEDDHGVWVSRGDYIDKDGNKITNGKGYVPDPATAAAFTNIPLIRNWAKIVVMSDTREDPETHLPNNPFFTPYSYAVVNVPSRGTIVPHSAATGFITDYQLLGFEELEASGYAANLPSGTIFDDSIPSAEDFVNCTGGVSAVGPDGAVYLYERPVPTENIPPSYVIVYGHYCNPDDLEHEGDYFYKVDLMVNAEYYPVFRNFKYQVIIRKILSQGHHTPAAAVAAAGSADVSADINARHLSDISDGYGRLAIQPWMAHTFTDKQTDNTLLHAFLMSDIYNGTIDMNPASVTVEKRPMPSGEEDLITDLSIDAPSTDAGSVGWRTIHFSTTEHGRSVRSQTIRITGYHEFGRLYRDVVITVQPIQPMTLACSRPRISAVKGSEQTISISIPDGLSESMFPLLFEIEPEGKSLSPDGSKENNNLPVVSGTSLSEHEEFAGKPSYHFVYTLSWDMYRGLETTQDDSDYSWRTFHCYFKSNCDESGTTVWVNNPYFAKSSVTFANYRSAMTFRNLAFTTPIQRAEDETMTVRFNVDQDPDLSYPDDFPEITLKPMGMIPLSDELIPGEVSGTYTFKPTSAAVELQFVTITDDGDLSLDVSAPEYDSQTLRSHYFSHVGFVTGHKLSNGSSWSNVVCGRVNTDVNKTVLFGYCDDPDALNATITLEGLTGLTPTKPTTYPSTPLGPRDQYGLNIYHELEFKTPSPKSYNPIEFTLSAPGYVVEPVRAGRMNGNIYTQVISNSNVFKPGNTYGFTVDNPSFSYQMDKSIKHNFTVSFDHIGDIRSAYPVGVMIPAGETVTITVSSDRPDCYVCYVELTIQARVTWDGKKRNLDIASGTTNDGTFEAYPGADNQYLWLISERKSTATLTIHAHDDRPIIISGMALKTYRGMFYD